MNEFSYMCNDDLVREVSGVKSSVFSTDLVNSDLTRLANMTVEELQQIKGIGPKTAKKILAAFELGRRLLSQRETDCPDLGTSIALFQHLYPLMGELDHEVAYLVIMDNHFHLVKTVKISEGGYTETSMDVRLIMKETLVNNGKVIAIAHNHPDSKTNPIPSESDNFITTSIVKACMSLRIKFMDHIIIGRNSYYSYYDHDKV